MKAPEAKPGWETGYFRVTGKDRAPLVHRFYHIFTGEIKEMRYDSKEENWFPLYVYMGRNGEAHREG